MLKVGLLGGSPPTYIMPIIPGASGSIYDSYDFSYQSYRPLYWLVNVTSPVETPVTANIKTIMAERLATRMP